MANNLLNETSPYLLQHANNPVNWFPWGINALNLAKENDKPIFLSIGYSACHWCHVMERESFEDVTISSIMNDNFVCIKVDREERPDLDHIYMMAVQSMIGHGGWPLSVFLTPDCEPFYGGTYFPPEQRNGMPGFTQVLQGVRDAYVNRRGDITNSVEQITHILENSTKPRLGKLSLDTSILSDACAVLKNNFDDNFGGFGTAPKFPQPMVLEAILRNYYNSKDEKSLGIIDFTLDMMSRGGIYDQIGGGFHRYSTDPFWTVPHFEKMLYDNALLSNVYTSAYQLTGNNLYKNIAEEILDYVLREMTSPNGGFYSTQDADSEGQEGKFFIWTTSEIDKILDVKESKIAQSYFGITDKGNFDGRNILTIPKPMAEFASDLGLTHDEVFSIIQQSRVALKDYRDQRVHPSKDEKIITSWNGLMIKSLVIGSVVFDRPDFLNTALVSAQFIMENMVSHEGRLLRTYKDGKAKLKGYLEDYASLADAFMSVYEATLNIRWLNEAIKLSEDMLDLFWDSTDGLFYDTGTDHESLLIRPRDIGDGAIPCGNSMASYVLFRLSAFTGEDSYRNKALINMKSIGDFMIRSPQGAGQWLAALDFYSSPTAEIAIIGPLCTNEARNLLREAHQAYLPNKIVAGDDGRFLEATSRIPLLLEKSMLNGLTTAFLCDNYVCKSPVTEPYDLRMQIQNRSSKT